MREFQCYKRERVLQKCTVAVHDGTIAVHDGTVAVNDGTVFRVGQHLECKSKILLLKQPHS